LGHSVDLNGIQLISVDVPLFCTTRYNGNYLLQLISPKYVQIIDVSLVNSSR